MKGKVNGWFLICLIALVCLGGQAGALDHCGLINSDQVWRAADNPHRITCNVTVDMDVTLTIEPGVRVYLSQNLSLIINGTLKAIGTPSDKIYFTSQKELEGGTPGPHDWQAMIFTATSVNDSLVNCVIRYGGGHYQVPYFFANPVIEISNCAPVFLNCRINNNFGDAFKCLSGAAPVLYDCYIHDNDGNAYYVDLVSFPDITFTSEMNSFLFNNHGNGIRVSGGTLNHDAVWRDMGPCYWLADANLIVGSDVCLTLDPGVVVKVGQNINIIVNGSLHAVGTSDSLIYFTSYRDDGIRQDTEGSGATSGGPHDWQAMIFTATSVNDSLVNCVIRYGGGHYQVPYFYANPVIEISNCAPVFQCCQFEYCFQTHFQTNNGANPAIKHCNFIGGTSINAINNLDPSVTIDATGNYWGNPNGPYDPTEAVTGPPDYNPGGTGCRVSDYVAYRPWSTGDFPCQWLTPPELIYPDTLFSMTTDTVSLMWYSIPNAVSYEILISQNIDFVDTAYHYANVSDTFIIISPEHNPTYHWKVKANSYCSWSEWSTIRIIQTPTGIAEIQSDNLPAEFGLTQNFPNPFNPATNIRFALPRLSDVTLDIYNIEGRRVKRLVDGQYSAGVYNVTWDGQNEQGNDVATGVYFYRLEAGEYVASKKMILLK